jgi:CRP-like cAMP-binding protein
MTQGQVDGDEMYIVSEGQAAIEIDDQIVATKTKGSFFGEIALLRNIPRTASVRAEGGPLRCLELARRSFDELLSAVIRTEFILSEIPLLKPVSTPTPDRRLDLCPERGVCVE